MDRSGEQVPADAQIVRTWGLELDESMLTGESRTVRKNEGDDVYSGSTAVSGMALVKVNAVGAHSYAATLTAQAKVYKKTVSDLNKGINTILKFMTFLVVPLCVLLIWSQVHAVGGWDVAVSTGQWRSSVVSAVAGVVGMITKASYCSPRSTSRSPPSVWHARTRSCRSSNPWRPSHAWTA